MLQKAPADKHNISESPPKNGTIQSERKREEEIQGNKGENQEKITLAEEKTFV